MSLSKLYPGQYPGSSGGHLAQIYTGQVPCVNQPEWSGYISADVTKGAWPTVQQAASGQRLPVTN